MLWADEQIDSWCLTFQAYRNTPEMLGKAPDQQQHHSRIRQEVLHHLLEFLDGRQTLQEFHSTLHHHLHPEWGLFGIQGPSGRTFLTKLVQAFSHEASLTQILRSGLRLPKDIQSARSVMERLNQFLEHAISTGRMSRANLQPARVPFFLSTWWALQDAEAWPRFAGALRRCLFRSLPLDSPTSDPITLYFAFRERFLLLKNAVGISAGELEQFLFWQHRQELDRKQTMPTVLQKHEPAGLDATSRRLHLQWLLSSIGKKVSCHIWLPRQEQEHVWKNERFKDLSLSSLPWEENAEGEHLKDIAILWLLKNEVFAVYDIALKEDEILPRLLNLYDLSLIRTKRKTRFCLVLPSQYFEQAQQVFARPLFRQVQERHPCALIAEHLLTQNEEHILRWATSPAVIEVLIALSQREHK